MNIFPVILAGGQGSRFWPMSRKTLPKQFLSISSDGRSLIQSTSNRVSDLCSADKVTVICNESQKSLVNEHLPQASVVCEPVARNTAAANALGAIFVQKQDPKGVMISMPADHYIEDEATLIQIYKQAAQRAYEQDVLVTMGVTPDRPETGYGYIERGEALDCERQYQVKRFVEKPDLAKAQQYLEDGGFFWNSGVFVWRVDVFLDSLKQHMAELHSGIMEIAPAIGTADQDKVLQELFPQLPSISIDYGLIEQAENRVVIETGNLGWTDVGSWDAWSDRFPADDKGNVSVGDSMLIDSKNCTINTKDRFVALVGCEDLVVVDSGDAVLVCPRERVQDVRKIVDRLKEGKREKLL